LIGGRVDGCFPDLEDSVRVPISYDSYRDGFASLKLLVVRVSGKTAFAPIKSLVAYVVIFKQVRFMKKLLTNLLIILIFSAGAQEIPMIHENDFAGISEITTRQFGYDGLWGYINGGADLYFEYGFEGVTAQNIRVNGLQFTADIYRMQSSRAAFGVFSVLRFRCSQTNLLQYPDCHTPYQFLAAKGEYFISVSNSTGSEKDQKTTLRITEILLERIEDSFFEIPALFRDGLFSSQIDDIKLIYGPLGMQNGFMRWDEMFAEFQDYETWVLPVEIFDARFNLGIIKFEDEELRDSFIARNKIAIVDPADIQPSAEVKKYGFILKEGMILYDGILPEEMLSPLKEMMSSD
jgi:hypothetical protein